MRKKILLIFCLSFYVTVHSFAQSVDSIDLNQIVVDTSVVIEEAMPDTTIIVKERSSQAGVKIDTIAGPVLESNPLKLSGFIPPASLMLIGLSMKGHSGLYSSYSLRQDFKSMFPGFYTPIDNYLQYIPLVSAYATGFISGTKPRHSNGRRLWMFVQAQVLTTVAVQALKHYTHEQRPNGDDYLSFPSGHAAEAFMGAALFDAEYPNQMKGLKIGLYTLAGLTGVLRMMNDEHWANDVLFGAGIGILSVRLLYWSEQHWKKKKTVLR
jgi:membrane-associated phospholipid phosphatase